MDGALVDEALLTAVRERWASVAGADGAAFAERGLRVTAAPAARTAPPGWCGAVAVGGRVLLTAPDAATARSLERAVRSAGLDDAGSLRGAVLAHALPGPLEVLEVLGPAALAYRAPGGSSAAPAASPSSSSSWAVEEADDDGRGGWRDELAGACSPEEVAESALEQLSHAHVVRDERGVAVAAAGWQDWDGGVAHVGVVAAPAARGRGAAQAAAAAAVDAAARAGLLVQWRAAPEPSRRLARRLGLVEVGWQLSWRWGERHG